MPSVVKWMYRPTCANLACSNAIAYTIASFSIEVLVIVLLSQGHLILYVSTGYHMLGMLWEAFIASTQPLCNGIYYIMACIFFMLKLLLHLVLKSSQILHLHF